MQSTFMWWSSASAATHSPQRRAHGTRRFGHSSCSWTCCAVRGGPSWASSTSSSTIHSSSFCRSGQPSTHGMIRLTHDSFSWNSFSRPIMAQTPQPHSQMTYPEFWRRVAL